MSPATMTSSPRLGSWAFRTHWRSAHYHTGDLYQDDLQKHRRKDWEVSPSDAGPYLQYLKAVALEWPDLTLLADFMEVGTAPLRWRNFHGDDKKNAYTYPDDKEDRRLERLKRVNKMHVCQIHYQENGTAALVGRYETPDALSVALEELDKGGKQKGFRLFVVEDLSTEVIEQLGYHFDIDPNFFRAHIDDYAWFNIRDPFWNPPSLHLDIVRRDWFQVRFCRARYFSSREDINKGQDAINLFNVERKIYQDENKAFWDTQPKPPQPGVAQVLKNLFPTLGKPTSKLSKSKPSDVEAPTNEPKGTGYDDDDQGPQDHTSDLKVDGEVGLMRSKATFWRKKLDAYHVGVLLLDPTIKEGFPLWRGYRNWGSIPPAQTKVDERQARLAESRVPSLVRGQGEPAASFFEDFIFWAQKEPVGFGKPTESNLHHIPTMALLHLVGSEWLTLAEYIKTRLSQIDWEITHPKEFLTQSRIDSILKKLHTWRRLVPTYREMLSETKLPIAFNEHTDKFNLIHPYESEFKFFLSKMEEFEVRIDRLTTVVTSAISIVDSRRVENLTLLATLFVPLSLVSSLFAMSEDITKIGATFGYWAATSLFLISGMLLYGQHTRSRVGSG